MEDRNVNLFWEDRSSEENLSLDSYYEPQPIFNLTIKNEINYWRNYLIFHFIYIPDKCPPFDKKGIKLGNSNSLVNPFRLVCNNYKCLYRCPLRKYSFFGKLSRLPASIIMKIMEKFIIEGQNSRSICKYIKDYYSNINLYTLQKITKWFRHAIAHFLKDEYRLNKLGNRNGTSNISIDESMFTHLNGRKIWVVGAKNNKTGKIRCDIFKNRNTENLKAFIYNHIKK